MGEEIAMLSTVARALPPLPNSDFVRRRLIDPNRPYEMAVHCG
jgi:hypothetical protein